MQTLVIRTDASSTMGTGHVMRMIALAQAYRRRGGSILFLTASCPDFLAQRVVEEGFPHREIPCEKLGDQQDVTLTQQACQEVDAEWIVLDGYHFQADYQKALQGSGLKVLCVDDFGHCEQWPCDALLNQNLGSEKQAHDGQPSDALLGSRYALLREEFLNQEKPPILDGPVKRLLISFGGSDPLNATRWILEQLNALDLDDLEIRVIIGPCNPHREELLNLDLSYPIERKTAVTDMPAEYAWADAIISAGGSSCWEWLYFRLRGAVSTIAENQEPISQELEEQRIALCLGWPKQIPISDTLTNWLNNPNESIDPALMSQLIDGRGADRVISLIDQTHCLIRRADPVEDAQFTFDLSNDPSVRSVGFSTDPITWEEHTSWLKRHHQSDQSHLFVAESLEGETLGFLRFHQRDTGWEIGIALVKEARGRGYADHIVSLGMRELACRFEIRQFIAVIRPTNSASKNLFERLGFTQTSSSDEAETWTHQLPS